MKNSGKKLLLLLVVAVSMLLSACDNIIDIIYNDEWSMDVVQSTDIQQETNSEEDKKINTASKETKSEEDKKINTVNQETNGKYDEFLEKAEVIKKYSRQYYEKATTQVELNTESYNVYMKWDALLNEVYQYLKRTMNPNDFAALEADEIEWIEEKERGIEEAAAEWEGGSGEALARNSAGIKYTRERCYYLISLVE